MVPAFIKPSANWSNPAIKTAKRKALNEPKSVIAVKTIAVKPAAGPETLIWDLLNNPTTIPPITPEIIPENKGAPLASAIPKHSGSATKKTTKPEAKSDLILEKIFVFFNIISNKFNIKSSFSKIATELLFLN